MGEQKLFFEDVNVGDEAPVTSHTLTRTDLVKYAGVSGDFNPMHHDEVAAQKAGQPSVFGHGMYSMGLLGSALTDYVGVGKTHRSGGGHDEPIDGKRNLPSQRGGRDRGCQDRRQGGGTGKLGGRDRVRAQGRLLVSGIDSIEDGLLVAFGRGLGEFSDAGPEAFPGRGRGFFGSRPDGSRGSRRQRGRRLYGRGGRQDRHGGVERGGLGNNDWGDLVKGRQRSGDADGGKLDWDGHISEPGKAANLAGDRDLSLAGAGRALDDGGQGLIAAQAGRERQEHCREGDAQHLAAPAQDFHLHTIRIIRALKKGLGRKGRGRAAMVPECGRPKGLKS